MPSSMTRMSTKVRMTLFAVMAINAAAASAQAQQYAPTAYTYAAPTRPAMQPAASQPQSGDPYGFTAWLNSTRARYGLSAVGYDASLTNWAAMNNSQQSSRGMGHYVMGAARRQNSAMGNYAQIGAMWLASPAHRAALLDPTIRRIGIAGAGMYWTFNAN